MDKDERIETIGCDLHVHSVYSDGLLDPREIVSMARSAGMRYLAVTDHDCYEGSLLAAKESDESLAVIPGVEVDVVEDVEILVYGTPNDRLLEMTRTLVAERSQVARRIVDAIRKATRNRSLDFDAGIAASARGSIMKPHMARLCEANGLAEDFLDFKRKLMEHWMPEGVPTHRKPGARDLVEWAREAGCKAILAHPLYYLLPRLGGKRYESVQELLSMDVDGYEFYYDYGQQGEDNRDLRRRMDGVLKARAEEESLFLTGGSDFHRPGDRFGETACPEEACRRLFETLSATSP